MRRSLVEFLGLRRSMLGLLGMVVLVGMGEKMAERFLPIYLIALGGGPLVVGLLNGLDNLLSALYSFPGGYLAERLGTKRALMVFNIMAMAGFVIVIAIPTWQAVIIGSVLFLSWTAISLPGTMKLVSTVLPKEKRTMGVSLHSLVRRIPMALGPLVGGALIAARGERDGVRLAFVAALVLAGVAAWLQHVLIEDDRGTHRAGASPSKNPLSLWRGMHPSLKNLLVADILVRFCEQIPYAFVVIWCMKTVARPVSAFQFGILTAVEMTTALLIYIPIAYLADRGNKKPYVVTTFGFFTIFPMVLMMSRSFWPLVFAFILRGLKEFGEPTRKALIMDLAPDDAKAATFGLYYLVRDVVVSLAAFGGSLLWLISPQVNFIAASAFGLLGTVWFGLRGRDLGAGYPLNGSLPRASG
ncbi:MFS transporter [Candidatus Fermentibacteria bacterium]|nr:MFS transporter [Candidatus Fermentibacteria bacterium]